MGGDLLPQDKLSALRRIGSLSRHLKSRRCPAELAGAVLHCWLESDYPHLRRAGLPASKRFEALPATREFAEWLGKQYFFDGAFWLASAYARWVTPAIREERALFFTPPQLATRLIDDLVGSGADLVAHKWMDPACGGAAFLAPLAARMSAALKRRGRTPRQILRHVETHLIGSDIDPFLCCLSRFFLKMALSDEIKTAGREPTLTVTTRDSLRASAHYGSVDVIACNPPYRKMAQAEVTARRRFYGDVMEGQPNIYALFFKLALRLLKPSGTAGLITPTSFLSGQSFSKLRVLLANEAATPQIDLVSSRIGIFVGVEQEAAITVVRPRRSASKRRTKIFAAGRDGRFVSVGTCSVPKDGRAWPIPRLQEDARAIKLVNGSTFRLKDYGYRARVGSYVDYRERQTKRIYYKIPQRPGETLYPLIWSSDISSQGWLQLGRHSNHAQPRYIRVSDTSRDTLLMRPSIALQRVTSSDQPKRLVGAVVPPGLLRRYGGAIGENHVLFLEQMTDEVKVAPALLAQILRASIIDRYFRCISGAANVSVFELNQLPLPDPELVRKELGGRCSVNDALVRAFGKQQSHEQR